MINVAANFRVKMVLFVSIEQKCRIHLLEVTI